MSECVMDLYRAKIRGDVARYECVVNM